ncbi:MAG: 8-oxoguanine deaminase [Pseudomonadota bacterium]
MTLTLVLHANTLVCMDDAGREIADGAMLVEDGAIHSVGTSAELAIWADKVDEIVEATGCVITPGLVNTHHHMFQSLTRAVPAGVDAPLFPWLQSLYPIWANYRPEDMFVSAQVAMAELALSGCTLSSDHLYLYPDGVKLEDTIEAARTIGMRFHPTRGSMSIGESKGGLPPDHLVEDEKAILNDTIRVIDAFHDTAPDAMVRVGVAPCSPFSVSQGLMRESALLARDKGVRLHTHLAENVEDVAYSLEHFGCRPGQYAEDLGWVGPDVWHAHCVQLDEEEIDLFARTKTGVAHCPCSNGRLGSGIAPIAAMNTAGIPVGLGVDGSASNDSNHLLLESRQALLFQRAVSGADALSARAALRLATRGGAEVLGWESCGQLAAGMRADFVLWDTNGLEMTGAWDEVAALVLCASLQARDVYVEGRAIVQSGLLTGVNLQDILTRAGASVKRLIDLA